MAKILRKAYKIFGSNAPAAAGGLEQFGGLAAGAVNYTLDIETLQALTAWADGWSAACLGTNSPVLEERNAVDHVHGYQIGYLLQQGIPEWISTQTYYKGNYVVDSNGDLRKCDVDNSTNDDPALDTTGVRWLFVGGGNASFPLFYFTFSDHQFNDASWLRADTFSWQSGAVYVSAYNHLVDDIDGITAETETVAGTTITFYRADDGHKIVDDTQVSNVEAIYAATGVAWYYILDTANQRFKLPRSKWNVVGLRDNVGNYVPESLPNITGTVGRTFAAENSGSFYTVNTTSSAQGGSGGGALNGFDASRSSAAYQNDAPVQQRSTQAYLYFYVGNTVQDQTTIDVGQITDALNGKVDLPTGGTQTSVGLLVESYSNGASWYRVYSDGWCEQGGVIESLAGGSSSSVVFLKEYKDTTYYFNTLPTAVYSASPQANDVLSVKSTTGITFTSGTIGTNNFAWYTCGYLA